VQRVRGPGLHTRQPELTRTSTALTDGFDAPTEALSEWNATGIEGVEGRDYEVSVSGYRNYVYEIEQMLGAEESITIPPLPHVQPSRGAKESGDGSSSGLGRGHRRHKSPASYPSKDILQQAAASRSSDQVPLVEEYIIEQGPSQTISLWRERVARSSENSNADGRQGQSHRKTPSTNAPAATSKISGGSSGDSKTKSISKGSSGDYERTEVSTAIFPEIADLH
jgi:hypothetical protein